MWEDRWEKPEQRYSRGHRGRLTGQRGSEEACEVTQKMKNLIETGRVNGKSRNFRDVRDKKVSASRDQEREKNRTS